MAARCSGSQLTFSIRPSNKCMVGCTTVTAPPCLGRLEVRRGDSVLTAELAGVYEADGVRAAVAELLSSACLALYA